MLTFSVVGVNTCVSRGKVADVVEKVGVGAYTNVIVSGGVDQV